MSTTTCTICAQPLAGAPDDDVCCPACEATNLAGDALRHPERPLLPAYRGQTFLGTWTWRRDPAEEETPDAP